MLTLASQHSIFKVPYFNMYLTYVNIPSTVCPLVIAAVSCVSAPGNAVCVFVVGRDCQSFEGYVPNEWCGSFPRNYQTDSQNDWTSLYSYYSAWMIQENWEFFKYPLYTPLITYMVCKYPFLWLSSFSWSILWSLGVITWDWIKGFKLARQMPSFYIYCVTGSLVSSLG